MKQEDERATISTMDEVARLLNDMVAAGVIDDYAVFGAVAQMRYTEAVATLDADILVVVPDADPLQAGASKRAGALNVLSPIYAFCREHGYQAEGEAIRVGDWPVQIIPAFDALTEAAVKDAETGDVDGVPLRVVGADYLAVIALSVGRAKDFTRILALRECEAVTNQRIAELADRYDLGEAWRSFLERFDEK